MKHASETLNRHAALWVVALLVVLAAGCDNRVDVQAPRVLPPTMPCQRRLSFLPIVMAPSPSLRISSNSPASHALRICGSM